LEKILIIEMIAILVGVVVIVIETAIIFLLLRHIRIMKRSFEESRAVILEFRRGINEHLEHMDAHSHKMEHAIEQIYAQICSIGPGSKDLT
jgi:hypothetical protein